MSGQSNSQSEPPQADSKADSSRLVVVAALAVVVAIGVGGWLAVRGSEDTVAQADSAKKAETKVATPTPEPTFASLKERGKWLFANKGCFACHGKDGIGGVANPGSIQGSVPSLNKLAERLMLFEQEDGDEVMKRLEAGTKFDATEKPAPFRTWSRFVAQYEAVQGVIKKGNPAGKKVAGGPAPPLNMPAWGSQLSRRDVDAIIIWLISGFDWDADDEDEDEDE